MRTKEPSEAGKGSSEDRWFESGLRFKCTGCGNCCSGSSGSVYLSAVDLERLANFFHLPTGAFVRKYTRMNKGRRTLINRPDSRDCVFLADRSCKVYEARPTQCRTYPWWLRNLHDRQSWDEAGQFCEGIDHPSAPLIPASEISEQCQIDLENDSGPMRERAVGQSRRNRSRVVDEPCARS
jgi:Fe-S-cluster containining protein